MVRMLHCHCPLSEAHYVSIAIDLKDAVFYRGNRNRSQRTRVRDTCVLLLLTVGSWVGLNGTTFTPDITKREPKVLKLKELPQKWSPLMPNFSLYERKFG